MNRNHGEKSSYHISDTADSAATENALQKKDGRVFDFRSLIFYLCLTTTIYIFCFTGTNMIYAYFHDSGNLSRPDVSLMSDQTLMELFVADFNDAAAFRNDDEGFLDITEWKGVAFDQDGHVKSIEICNCYKIILSDDLINSYTFLKEGGKVRFDCLPSSLHYLELPNLSLEGTIETEELPPCMRRLVVHSNSLSGTFSIPGFPQRIEEVNIEGNYFTGSLKISELPKSMKDFNAQCNRFSGSLELTRLPNDLKWLKLGSNGFSGSISLECLPRKLESITLDNNAFSHDCVVVGEIPLRLREISLRACGISRAVDQSGNQLVDYRVRIAKTIWG